MKDTNLLLDSRLFNPSTAFHEAEIDVVVAVVVESATAIEGRSTVVTGAVVVSNDNFWNCSMISRRVEVGPEEEGWKENPFMAVMQITSAMQQYDDDRRGTIIDGGLIMVDKDMSCGRRSSSTRRRPPRRYY